MALIDDFESYSTGNLNGQGSWSGSTDFKVQTSVVNSGSNAVSITNNSDTVFIEKTFTAAATGIQTFYIRTTTLGRGSLVRLRTSTTNVASIGFHTSNQLRFNDNASYVLLDPYVVNTWYKCDIEWDSSRGANGEVRGRLDDGTWTDWIAGLGSFSTVDNIQLISDVREYGTVYFDDLEDGAATSVKDIIGQGFIPFAR